MASHVASIDWSFTDRPLATSETWQGLSRSVLVGPDQGAVHSELAVGSLAPDGWLQRHFHSFEESLYVLAGELVVMIDERVHRLVSGDYAFTPVGTWHALANGGTEPTRWLSVSSPMRLPPDAGRRDTFFAREPFDLAAIRERAERPPSATTTAPRRRWRRCRSPIRLAAAGLPAATRRSWCTAESA
jgi:quercetin dioxygenase-like cupin family protein